MFPLLLALGSGLAWGTGDFVGGLLTKRLAAPTVLVVSQTSGLIFMAALVVALGEPAPATEYLVYGLLGGVAGGIGLEGHCNRPCQGLPTRVDGLWDPYTYQPGRRRHVVLPADPGHGVALAHQKAVAGFQTACGTVKIGQCGGVAAINDIQE